MTAFSFFTGFSPGRWIRLLVGRWRNGAADIRCWRGMLGKGHLALHHRRGFHLTVRRPLRLPSFVAPYTPFSMVRKLFLICIFAFSLVLSPRSLCISSFLCLMCIHSCSWFWFSRASLPVLSLSWEFTLRLFLVSRWYVERSFSLAMLLIDFQPGPCFVPFIFARLGELSKSTMSRFSLLDPS